MKEWLLRLLIIASTLAICEGTARFFYHPIHLGSGDWFFEFDNKKNYRLVPSNVGMFGPVKFVTNSQHRVGRAFEFSRTSAKRIVLLGDSVSFGFKMPYEKTFASLLEEKKGFEILNYGVPGYSTFQEYYDLKDGLKYCPDLAVLQFSFNDMVEPFHYLRRLGGIGIDYHGIPDASGLHFFFRSRSRLYEWFSDLLLTSYVTSYGNQELLKMKERQVKFSELKVFTKLETPESEAAWAEFSMWLKKISLRCKEANTPCAFFVSPHSLRYYHADQDVEKSVARLKNLAEQLGFTVWDPWQEVLAEVKKSKLPFPVARWNTLFLDDIHPNEKGNAFFARYLDEKLRAMLPAKNRNCGVN